MPSRTAPAWVGFPVCIPVSPARSLRPGLFLSPSSPGDSAAPGHPGPELEHRPSPPLAPSAGAPPAACSCWDPWAEVRFGGGWFNIPWATNLVAGDQSQRASQCPGQHPAGHCQGWVRRRPALLGDGGPGPCLCSCLCPGPSIWQPDPGCWTSLAPLRGASKTPMRGASGQHRSEVLALWLPRSSPSSPPTHSGTKRRPCLGLGLVPAPPCLP